MNRIGLSGYPWASTYPPCITSITTAIALHAPIAAVRIKTFPLVSNLFQFRVARQSSAFDSYNESGNHDRSSKCEHQKTPHSRYYLVTRRHVFSVVDPTHSGETMRDDDKKQ